MRTQRRAPAENILIDGDAIHDQTTTNADVCHVDGLALFGSNNVTIKNTKFYGNEVTNMRVQDNTTTGQQNTNLTLVNNWFGWPTQEGGTATRWDAIDIDQAIPGLKILFNSFAGNSGIQADTRVSPYRLGTSSSPAEVVGNAIGLTQCYANTNYRYNVFVPFSEGTGQTPCTATDKRVAAHGYVSNPSSRPWGIDFHLTSSAPELNFVGSGCYATDIDASPRSSSNCDAGSDER